jgi:hypothetical protein
VFGQNLDAAATAVLTDFDGNQFNMVAQPASSELALVGPFSAPGSSSPVEGNAILVLYNASGIAVASTVVMVGPAMALWTPATEATLVEWLKADAINLTSGSSVAGWPNSAGSDATGQPGSQPTFLTQQQNGLPIVRFNGTNQVMETGAFTSQSQPFTMAIAFRYNGPGTNDVIAGGSISSSMAFGALSGDFFVTCGNVVDLQATDSSFHVLFLVFNGASTAYAFDGAAPQTVGSNPGTNGIGQLVLAAAYNNTSYAQVDIGEIALWSGDGSMFYSDLTQYMQQRWNP